MPNKSRRDVLKIGFGLMTTGLLAACGAPSVASSPAATTAPAAATQAATSASTTSGAMFQIDQSATKASFTLGEKLMGTPKTVVGTTSNVSGSISISLDNPSTAKIGIVQIDAKSFSTDSDMRNGAIQRFILQSAQAKYQFITFEPTKIDGLTGPVSAGTAVPVKVTGNLKIKDTVKPVTFDGTVTLKSDTQMEGNLKATVTRADFGLTIPNVPSVADVTDEVKLELQFAAMKQ